MIYFGSGLVGLALFYKAAPTFATGTAGLLLLLLLANRWNILERDFQIGGFKF